MDFLREIGPFLIGLLVPPIVMLYSARTAWTGQLKFMAAFMPALILGFCTSALAGELMAGMPDGLIAVVIDTALVYTGSQVAYWFFWKPVVESYAQRQVVLEKKRVRK